MEAPFLWERRARFSVRHRGSTETMIGRLKAGKGLGKFPPADGGTPCEEDGANGQRGGSCFDFLDLLFESVDLLSRTRGGTLGGLARCFLDWGDPNGCLGLKPPHQSQIEKGAKNGPEDRPLTR